MKTVDNILWILLRSGILALLWGVIAIVCCCTTVGIPFDSQSTKFAHLPLCHLEHRSFEM